MTGVAATFDAPLLAGAAERLGLRLVVLFGSRATGDPPPTGESDLDIAVLGGPHRSDHTLLSCYEELSPVFGDYSLDLVLLNDVDHLLRHEVMARGVLLWGDPLDFLEYRAFAYRDFVDSRSLRVLEETLFRKKLAHLRSNPGAAS